MKFMDMLSSNRRIAAAGVILALGLSAAPAAAQQIGQASAVENQVTRVSSSGTAALSVGGSVFRMETIRTAQSSRARLTFLDNTNLSVGPSSSVVLNQFVYTGNSQAKTVGVNLVRGAFRFSTGDSDKSAYRINTPVATIGVRGTVLDIRSAGGTTDITMVDNSEALVCSISAGSCVLLSGAGSSVRVTSSGVTRLAAGTGFSFASNCTGNICGSRFAGNGPIQQGDTLIVPVNAGSDLLCGR